MRISAIRGIVGFVLAGWWLVGSRVLAAEMPVEPTSPTVIATSPTAVSTLPTSPGLAGNLAAEKWLRTLEQRHRDHRRASGDFTQTKKDPVFLEERRSTGKFYYERPNRFRCDYDQDKPDEACTTLVDGDLVSVYFPKQKEMDRYRLSREGSGIGEVNQMLLAFGVETDKVLKHFTVVSDPATTANVVRLTFVPKAPREERPFEQFILELSKPDLTPKRFDIIGGEDDHTVVTITTITWNPSLPPDIFRLNVPKDVEIIEER